MCVTGSLSMLCTMRIPSAEMPRLRQKPNTKIPAHVPKEAKNVANGATQLTDAGAPEGDFAGNSCSGGPNGTVGGSCHGGIEP